MHGSYAVTHRIVSAHILGKHNTLVAEQLRSLGNDLRRLHRRRVQTYFVGTCTQNLLNILCGPDARRQRSAAETAVSSAADNIDHRLAVVL